MTSSSTITGSGVALRAPAGGRVQLPGDLDYDSARHGFALAVDQYPAAVA